MCDDEQYSQLSTLAVPVLPEPVSEPLAERILQSRGRGARRSFFHSHSVPQRFVEWPQVLELYDVTAYIACKVQVTYV
jgi:hypothetical protein